MTFDAVVVDAPTPDCSNMLVDNAPDEDTVVGLERAEIVWHLNPGVHLSRTAIQIGARVRITRRYWMADRVEILGPSDAEFAAHLDRWAIEHMPVRLSDLTPSDLRLLTALGSPYCQVREQATAVLRERGYGALRPLLWGRRSPDPETRARAGVLLRGLGWREDISKISR